MPSCCEAIWRRTNHTHSLTKIPSSGNFGSQRVGHLAGCGRAKTEAREGDAVRATSTTMAFARVACSSSREKILVQKLKSSRAVSARPALQQDERVLARWLTQANQDQSGVQLAR